MTWEHYAWAFCAGWAVSLAWDWLLSRRLHVRTVTAAAEVKAEAPADHVLAVSRLASQLSEFARLAYSRAPRVFVLYRLRAYFAAAWLTRLSDTLAEGMPETVQGDPP